LAPIVLAGRAKLSVVGALSAQRLGGSIRSGGRRGRPVIWCAPRGNIMIIDLPGIGSFGLALIGSLVLSALSVASSDAKTFRFETEARRRPRNRT
jgi:hypothetical protein